MTTPACPLSVPDTPCRSRWSALRHSLRLRILLALLLVFVLGFATLAIYIYDIRDQVRRAVTYLQAEEIAAGITAASDLEQLPTHYAGGALSYALYQPDGTLLWHSANQSRPRRLWRELWPSDRPLLRLPRDHGRVINVPVHLADGNILMVAKEDRRERAQIEQMLEARLLEGSVALLPVGLLALLLMLGLLYWTLRPVRRAARLAQDIGPRHPAQRLPVATLPTELHELATAVNQGLDRVATALETERRFVADAAHALRTPLSVLSLRLQGMRQGLPTDWHCVEHDVQAMHRLVSQLLGLARQEGTRQQPPALTPQRFSAQARQVVASLHPWFDAQARPLEVDIEDDLRGAAPAGCFEEVLRNLLENALLHGAGTVRVTLRQSGATCQLTVSDDGPGPQDAEHAFERFQTTAGAQGSTGLGLAIVRQAMHNLGGTVAFLPGAPCRIQAAWPLREAVADTGPVRAGAGANVGAGSVV